MGGAAGGYTAGPRWMITLLRQRARPYLFSNSLPPAVVAAGSAALDLLTANHELPLLLAQNTARFRERMTAAGFTLSVRAIHFCNVIPSKENILQGDAEHPIAPVMLGDAELATTFADKMLG